MGMKAHVKSKPNGFAKGEFACDLTSSGLLLTKRNTQIEVPVGADVFYPGGAKIEVKLPEAFLEIVIKKLGAYQNRLAEDVATFLQGKRELPDLHSYSLPWYAFSISLLPLGIPVLTLGGAIPTGIGAGLAAACYGIMQKEEWGMPKRILSVVLINIAAYAATFTLLAIVLSNK